MTLQIRTSALPSTELSSLGWATDESGLALVEGLNMHKIIPLKLVHEYLDALRAIAWNAMAAKGDLGKSRTVSDVVVSVFTEFWAKRGNEGAITYAEFKEAVTNYLIDKQRRRDAQKRPKFDPKVTTEDAASTIPDSASERHRLIPAEDPEARGRELPEILMECLLATCPELSRPRLRSSLWGRT